MAETPDTDKPMPTAGERHEPVEAEVVEGRGLAMRNAGGGPTCRTQSRESVSSAIDRIREVAVANSTEQFTTLFHHLTVDLLHAAFLALNRRAAVGVDEVTWQQYEGNLADNLRDLHDRLHRGAYRAKPSRRHIIAKADGRPRLLGIAALEDKIVQRAVAEILLAIYEADFLGFSYGFRPGRHPHMALDALATGIVRKPIRWVLDADIRAFFDSLSRDWLVRFLEHRIADRRLIRLIQKWLSAGVMDGESWTDSAEGVPQGAPISPILANVYLHYVFDLWAHRWRRTGARGEVIIVRYADDFIVGFEHQRDAEKFRRELQARLQTFALDWHPDKTRLIEFGRYAMQNRSARGLGRPETFDFLGFTHVCSRDSKGMFILARRSMRKRMRAKLGEIKLALRLRFHQSVPDQGKWLQSVVRGWLAYHAVPTNIQLVTAFYRQVKWLWKRALGRRSQRGYVTWSRMHKLAARWLPSPKIHHPWPQDRFERHTQGRSPVR